MKHRVKRRALRRRYGRSRGLVGLPTESDLNFVVRELGLDGAIRYAEALASRQGPLAQWYRDAYRRLAHRANAKLAEHNRRNGYASVAAPVKRRRYGRALGPQFETMSKATAAARYRAGNDAGLGYAPEGDTVDEAVSCLVRDGWELILPRRTDTDVALLRRGAEAVAIGGDAMGGNAWAVPVLP